MATVGSMAVVLTASVTDFERTMGRAARAVKSTEREFMQSARRMQDIGRKWTLGVTAPIVAGITAVSKAAIDWEDSFAGVRKSVDGTEEQLTQLDKSLRKMTETIPLDHKELANIAESAGQLGIQTDNIAEFVKTMAMLGSTTKMSADDAATGLAQIDNIMGTGQRSFDRYGSTVLALGNNLATTEQKIVDFTLRIAGAGKIAGLTEAQVMAISGAFGSVGVEAQAGGTAVSKALMGMTEAVATGDRRLAMFARTAGMSAAEFAQTWRTDAGEAFTRFVEGLGRSGDKAFGVLRELGLSDQRLIRGFLSVANAGDLLRKSMDIGTKAWEENVVLVQKAQERYKTAASRLKMLGSRAKNVAISFGGALAPMIGAAMDKFEKFTEGLQRMADRFAELPEPVRKTTISLLLLLAAVGPVTYGIGLLNRTIAGAIGVWGTMVAFAGNAVFAFTSWRMGAATLGESLTYLAGGPVKLAILGIGAAVVATILLAANWEKFSAFAARVWSGVSAAVLYASSIIVRGVGMMITAISWIVPGLSGAAQAVMGLADGLKSSAAQALQSAQTTAQIAEQADKAASAADGAAKAQEGLAGALEMAEEAASGGLQSFDEVHQMQDQMSAADMFGDMDFPELDIPEIPSIGDTFAEGIAKIGEVVTNVTDTAVSAWERLKTSIEPVNTAVEWMRDNWPTIGPIIEQIGSLLTVVMIPALINTGVQASIAFGKMAAGWIASGAEAAVSAGAQVAHFTTLVGKWILLGLEASAAAAKAVAAWVMQGLEAASSVAIQAVHFATIVGKWVLLGAEATIQGAKIAAAWVASMGPVAWVIATIAAVAVAVALNWDEVKAVTERVWSGISTWLSDTWEGIKSLASSIWDGIKNVIGIAWDAIKGATIAVWDAIAGALKTAWDGIVFVATAVWDGLKGVIGAAWDAISLAATTAWEGIQTVLSTVWAGITFLATTVWDGIVSIVTGTWDAIKTVAGPAWEGIKTVLSVAWDAIAGVATTVWDGLVTGVSSAWDSISKASNAVWTRIKESLSGLWDGIAAVAATAWDGIKSTIGSTWDNIEKTTQKLWDGLSKWLDDSWNSIHKAAKAIWDKIPKPITDAVSASVKSVTGFAKDVIKWVDDMGTKALKAVQDMANGIVQWIRDLPKRTMDSVKSWTTGVIDSVRNMYKTIVGGSIIPDMVKESVGWFDILKNQSVAIVGEMGQRIVGGVATFTDSALGKMGSFGEAFQSIAQQISTGMQSVFGQAFDGIINGSMTMGEAFQSVLSGMGAVLKNVLVQQLSQAASNALSTLGSWIISVLSKVATAISAVITQAYTTLVAFYAWSGPAAPVLAAGTIAAAIAGIGALAAKAVGAFKGVTGLAQGGIVTGPTLAMVGEGHRREAVIPLERDNVIADSVGQAVYEAMLTAIRVGQATGQPSSGDREIVLRINGRDVARAVLPDIIAEGQRQGLQLMVRPQGV